jgi:hypothetical protein
MTLKPMAAAIRDNRRTSKLANIRSHVVSIAPSISASFGVLLLLTTYTTPVCALNSPTPEPGAVAVTSASQDTVAPIDRNGPETPNSTEQGHTQMSDSFLNRPIATLLDESSLVGLRDTTFNSQIRSYYFDRDNMDHTTSLAWTLGGSAGVKTGYFGDFVALGATGYTSQRLVGPLDEDGTPILQPGQKPYTVLGELYGEFKVTDQILATVGDREFNTPFINTQDGLMTAYTYQVYGVQGKVGSTEDKTLTFGAAYVDKIKPRNSAEFESMATAAGAPAGVTRGVYVVGANYRAGQLSIGAVEYYRQDIINILYPEVRYAIPLTDRMQLLLHAQYTDERSNGQNLITGKSFSTHMVGLKSELAVGPALLTVARTITAVGTLSSPGGGTDIRTPWGGYAGYTSVMIENFDRAGENATMLRAAYNFPRLTGLSAYGLWVRGSTPNVVNQYAQHEYDYQQ